MSTDSDASSVSRRQFLAVASGVAAAGSISVGKVLASPPAPTPPPPPADYPVTVDVTKNPISYTANGHNAYRLRPKVGKTITWAAKTSGAQHRLTVLFVKETPLIDANNNPLYAVHSSDSDPGVVGTIDPDASGTYEYYVAVFDDVTHSTYTDDPKIIVGSGNIVTPAELEPELNEVLGKVKELTSSRADQRKKVEAIEDKLEALIKELK
jgi:hypothetical protein